MHAGSDDALDIPVNAMASLMAPVKLAGLLAVLLSSGTPAHEAVIGGAPAQGGAFASVAEIFDFRGKEAGQCTGTVVAPRLVLTAGHCAENMRTGVVNEASGYSVLTGEATGAGVERQVSAVSGVILYSGMVRRVDDGDAALLALSTPTTAPAITLAGSTTGELPAGSKATFAGWGKTSYAQRSPTEQLQSASTVVQGDRWCKNNAPPFYARNEICTIDPPHDATGACSGDSGGPLLAPQENGGDVQVGIAVHVYDKCSTRRPSVFTSVGAIAAWVDTWIDAYSLPSAPPAP